MPLRILIGVALTLSIALGSMDILIILILPVHESSISFHLFMWFLPSFINVLSSSASLVRFAPRHFILFDAIVNKTVFSMSLYYSLLVYRNMCFCMLIFCPITLMNPFFSSNGFLVVSLRLSVNSIMSSAKNDSFTSSFSVSVTFTTCVFLKK